ncbi:MAG TPA: ATP-binding protein [Steroidobacteraceae bacterium]|nr:ATP-binding protein [Steroidobacteraceae bacterium]
MRSISRRLLVCLTLLLLLFFGVMIAVLDGRFRQLAEGSLRGVLDAELVALIATAEPDATGHYVPRVTEAEDRLSVPGSGLYAAVGDAGGIFWRSPSAAGSVVDFGSPQPAGGHAFGYLTDAHGARLAAVSRGLEWEGAGTLTFTVASDMASYNAQLARFRQGLAGGFAVVALLLLAALALLLRWALTPLRRLEGQIRAVERGERAQLDDRWPSELHGVVANLNALLDAERTRIARYRDTLGNLAHSLKTPLAVLRAAFTSGVPAAPDAGSKLVNEQVERMSAIVEHQLRRAATSGGASVGQQALEVLPIAQDLRRALLKAHGRKDFSIELEIPGQLLFVGDRDDLTEALGNLMDNAAKWCRARVRVVATLRREAGAGQKLQLAVEDDGPGIPAAERERVLLRGARADEQVPGHGLGLAMVRDMAGLYGGRIAIGESVLGGCRIELRLPGRLK